jgi:NAD(P)-dependent dehydrogenase (short-subunit alcohol dehydrogenase family)/uncharacterized OB-fold protein
MKRRPDLPPRVRGRLARRLTAAAALGAFELPVCEDCGTVVFPLQELCRSCLSDRLRWQPVPPVGRVLTHGLIRHSTDAYFTRLTPIRMGTVQLDAGPVVFTRLAPDCAGIGARVRLFNCLDRSGEQVFVAMPEHATMETNIIQDPNREVRGKVVLITGADGGIGRALVAAFIEAGAAKVVAASRRGGVRPLASDAAASNRGGSDGSDPVHLTLDITDPGSVAEAAQAVGAEVDILVNNAGYTAIGGLLDADSMEGARREMEVNYFGTLNMIRAFAPFMKERRQGTILNVLTVLAHASLPSMGSYCASKAAALSLTQGVRAELMPWGVRVAAIFPSTVDTPASADSPPPKLQPKAVAEAVVTMIERGLEDHYPGRIAADLYAGWRDNHKVVERELGLALPEPR